MLINVATLLIQTKYWDLQGILCGRDRKPSTRNHFSLLPFGNKNLLPLSFSGTLDSPAIIDIFLAFLPLAVALWLSFEQQNVSRNNMYRFRFIFVCGKWLSSHFFSFLLQEVVITRAATLGSDIEAIKKMEDGRTFSQSGCLNDYVGQSYQSIPEHFTFGLLHVGGVKFCLV